MDVALHSAKQLLFWQFGKVITHHLRFARAATIVGVAGVSLIVAISDSARGVEFANYRLAYRLDGTTGNQTFAFSARTIDDLSGDGINDLVIGSPTWNRGGTQSVWLYELGRTRERRGEGVASIRA
jgi:hypothetical protein